MRYCARINKIWKLSIHLSLWKFQLRSFVFLVLQFCEKTEIKKIPMISVNHYGSTLKWDTANLVTNEKSTIFLKTSWNLVNIIYSWDGIIHQVSWCTNFIRKIVTAKIGVLRVDDFTENPTLRPIKATQVIAL